MKSVTFEPRQGWRAPVYDLGNGIDCTLSDNGYLVFRDHNRCVETYYRNRDLIEPFTRAMLEILEGIANEAPDQPTPPPPADPTWQDLVNRVMKITRDQGKIVLRTSYVAGWGPHQVTNGEQPRTIFYSESGEPFSYLVSIQDYHVDGLGTTPEDALEHAIRQLETE